METALRGEEEKMIERKYYLAKPNPVEAIRLTPDVVALIADTSDVAHELLVSGQALYQDEDDRIFQIRTGDYLVKTGADAFIPIPPKLFERAYDRLEQEPATWVWDNDAIDWGLGAWVCSRCHGRNNIHAGRPGYDDSISANPYAWSGAQYCPHCGAPMHERKEE